MWLRAFLTILTVVGITPSVRAQFVQQGGKLVGSGAQPSTDFNLCGINFDSSVPCVLEGNSVALTADGNTAIVGGPNDGGNQRGAAWVFVRANGAWTQQGAKLTPTDSVLSGLGVGFGNSVALSADGNTAVIGGPYDNDQTGAAWVFTRSNGAWTQQGGKLVGSNGVGAHQGWSVSIAADGNTVLMGGPFDGNATGAAWVFTRSGGVWTQQRKLTATGVSGDRPQQGWSVALSGDGNTALLGTPGDNNYAGAAYVFTRNGNSWAQQARLPDTGGGEQGWSVALSGDGNTALLASQGGANGGGAASVFTRANNTWTLQQNLSMSGVNGNPGFYGDYGGWAVGLTSDGNAAIVGFPYNSLDITVGLTGAAWIFKRSGSVWTQQGSKLVGTGAGRPAEQGYSVALSGNGSTAILGGPFDSDSAGGNYIGAAWVFAQPVAAGPPASPGTVSPPSGSGLAQTVSVTFNDPRGWQDLDVVNVLVNNVLDGRNACYVAYSRTAGVLYLVPDAGGGLLPALTLGSGGSTANSQCTVAGTGSSAAGNGNTLTLTLNLTFAAGFAGNRVVYTAARDLQGGNSGWQALGTWSVPGANTFPSVTSLNPARNASSGGTFTFTFTDTKGYQDLGVVDVLINSAIDGHQACYVAYSRPFNVVYVVTDSGTGLSAGLPLNGSGSVGNSQCTVNGAGSSAMVAGNTLTLALNLTFTAAFDGNRVIYAAARDSNDVNNSGWQAMGSLTVQ